MENFIEILQDEWAIRALFASSMVGLMCGVLGCFIVLRNMALIGDALAHVSPIMARTCGIPIIARSVWLQQLYIYIYICIYIYVWLQSI